MLVFICFHSCVIVCFCFIHPSILFIHLSSHPTIHPSSHAFIDSFFLSTKFILFIHVCSRLLLLCFFRFHFHIITSSVFSRSTVTYASVKSLSSISTSIWSSPVKLMLSITILFDVRPSLRLYIERSRI